MKYQLIIPFGTEIFHKRGPMCIWDSNKVTAVFESSFIDDTASFQFTHKGNGAMHYSTGYSLHGTYCSQGYKLLLLDVQLHMLP